jgi:hypothetical protein
MQSLYILSLLSYHGYGERMSKKIVVVAQKLDPSDVCFQCPAVNCKLRGVFLVRGEMN